jgi:NADH-quinone oxidoreductase subunit G
MSTAPTPHAPPTVSLKIDGRPVTVPKGTNVLEAALKLGVDISYFCYHPGLSAPAVCRQCLVEIQGQPKLAPSCYTPVSEGMEVFTESEKVRVARQQMLEFTLVNHPVDCPICDKAGECTLQKLYFDWDHKQSRVDVIKVQKPKVVDVGPHIMLDQERCILCTRCIRVCDEVARSPQLTMAARGDRQVLTTAPGTQLDNPYSINTVDVCPVGALTAKDFRFTMRAWELQMVPSVCTGCATGCNDEIQFSAGRIWRLYPRYNPDINQYWMCDEGRFTYKEIHERRLAVPTVGGEPASWERALKEVATRLAGPLANDRGRVAVVFSAQATNEDNYALARLAFDQLGIERAYLGARPAQPERADAILRHADVNPNTAGARACGRGVLRGQDELSLHLEQRAVRALVVMGEDLTLSPAALAKLAELDALVVLGCHENDLTRAAQVALPARAWAEVQGTVTNAKGTVQRLNAALDPAGDARPYWELVSLVSRSLGHPLEWADARAVFREMVEKVRELKGASWGRTALPIQLRFAGSRG